MPDVKIRFGDGFITSDEAKTDRYVLAAPPPAADIYAFERGTDARTAWAEEHGCGALLARAMEAVKEASAKQPDRNALEQQAKEATERLKSFARELEAADGRRDPIELLHEATRRRVLGSVTLFSSPFYELPLSVLPASIPNISWIAGGSTAQSIYSTYETAFLYDQPDFGPNLFEPREIVWPDSGIPDLLFDVQSIFISA